MVMPMQDHCKTMLEQKLDKLAGGSHRLADLELGPKAAILGSGHRENVMVNCRNADGVLRWTYVAQNLVDSTELVFGDAAASGHSYLGWVDRKDQQSMFLHHDRLEELRQFFAESGQVVGWFGLCLPKEALKQGLRWQLVPKWPAIVVSWAHDYGDATLRVPAKHGFCPSERRRIRRVSCDIACDDNQVREWVDFGQKRVDPVLHRVTFGWKVKVR
jgi:hypothetical protein